MDIGKWLRLQWDRVLAWVFVAAGRDRAHRRLGGRQRVGLRRGQLPYIISGGVGGIFLLGVGATLWLSADLRDEWRKLDSIEDALREEQRAAARGRRRLMAEASLPRTPPDEGPAQRTRRVPSHRRARCSGVPRICCAGRSPWAWAAS